MAEIAYPSSLPGPMPGSFAPRPRRAASQLDGPLQQRSRQRDAAGLTSQYTYAYTPEQMAVWLEWYRSTLTNGRRWFVHALPGRGGLVNRVVRYRSVQQQLLGAGIYSVTCQFEQRGAAYLATPEVEYQAPPGFDVLSANIGAGNYSNSDRTVSYTSATDTVLTVAVWRPRFRGKYCWEVRSDSTGLVQEFGWACKAALPIGASIASNPNNHDGPGYGYFMLYVTSGATTKTPSSPGPSVDPHGSNRTYRFAVDFNDSTVGNQVWFGVGDTWIGDPGAGTGGTPLARLGAGSPAISSRGDDGPSTSTVNLTTAQLSHAAPAGFKPWGDPDSVDNDA